MKLRAMRRCSARASIAWSRLGHVKRIGGYLPLAWLGKRSPRVFPSALILDGEIGQYEGFAFHVSPLIPAHP